MGADRQHLGPSQRAVVLDPEAARHLAAFIPLLQINQFPHLPQMPIALYSHQVNVEAALIGLAHLGPVSVRTAAEQDKHCEKNCFHVQGVFQPLGIGVGGSLLACIGYLSSLAFGSFVQLRGLAIKGRFRPIADVSGAALGGGDAA